MASKERQKRERQIISAQAQLESAPSTGKCRYLKLPEIEKAKGFKLKQFKPEKGKTYTAVFLPWKAGSHNPAAKKGNWTTNRFLAVHRAVGPGEEDYLCPHKTHDGKCCFCARFKSMLAHDNSRNGYDKAKDFKVKDRELFLLWFPEETKKVIYVWDESTFLFGETFRAMYKKRPAWMNYASLDDNGCTVEFTASEKKIGQGTCVECGAVVIEKREDELPDWVVDACYDLCPDDWVVEVPQDELAKMFAKTAAQDEEEDEDEVEEDEDEDEVDEEEVARKKAILDKKKKDNAAAKANSKPAAKKAEEEEVEEEEETSEEEEEEPDPDEDEVEEEEEVEEEVEEEEEVEVVKKPKKKK